MSTLLSGHSLAVPICLPNTFFDRRDNVTVIGNGRNGPIEDFIFREATLKAMTADECKERFSVSSFKPRAWHLCASSQESSACGGDSGGITEHLPYSLG